MNSVHLINVGTDRPRPLDFPTSVSIEVMREATPEAFALHVEQPAASRDPVTGSWAGYGEQPTPSEAPAEESSPDPKLALVDFDELVKALIANGLNATSAASIAHQSTRSAEIGPEFEALAERSNDSQRCIDARNALNAALHGEGAVIDDLERSVMLACRAIARDQARRKPQFEPAGDEHTL